MGPSSRDYPLPRDLSLAEEAMVDFIIFRRFGILSPSQIDILPIPERNILLTEEFVLNREDEYYRLRCMSVEKLEEENRRERDALESEALSYAGRLQNSELTRWLHADSWELEEALALAFGCRPTPTLASWSQTNEPVHPWAKEVSSFHDYIKRAVSIGALKNPTAPKLFVDWAVDRALKMDPTLSEYFKCGIGVREEVLRLKKENTDLTEQIKELRTIMRKNDGPDYNVILKMFGAVCRELYGYSRSKARNSATRRIAEAVEKYTDVINSNTDNARDKFVLRRIQEAMEVIDKDHRIEIHPEGTANAK